MPGDNEIVSTNADPTKQGSQLAASNHQGTLAFSPDEAMTINFGAGSVASVCGYMAPEESRIQVTYRKRSSHQFPMTIIVLLSLAQLFGTIFFSIGFQETQSLWQSEIWEKSCNSRRPKDDHVRQVQNGETWLKNEASPLLRIRNLSQLDLWTVHPPGKVSWLAGSSR